MIINNNFNRLYWGLIINDIKLNLNTPIVLNHSLFGHIKVDLKHLSKDSIHQLLKQLTSYPKDENFKAKSLKDVTSKELCLHIEEVKVILANNGFTFKMDNDEWDRLIKEAKQYRIK